LLHWFEQNDIDFEVGHGYYFKEEFSTKIQCFSWKRSRQYGCCERMLQSRILIKNWKNAHLRPNHFC
jgi:hypothetical protein